jgi:transcriptional regulator with XRE-family HTH domain
MQENTLCYELAQKLIYGIGNKLKTVREYYGLKIEQLSEMSAVDENTINFMEMHRIELMTPDLCKIADSLCVDAELLLDNSTLLEKKEEMLLDNIFFQIKSIEDKKGLEEQILNWLAIVLCKKKQEWLENRRNSVDVLCALQRKEEASKRGRRRDEKYAPFREYFRNLQKQKILEYQKQGRKLSANAFANWFMNHFPTDVEVPYCQTNMKNKLIQLAQTNNREFKNTFECKS